MNDSKKLLKDVMVWLDRSSPSRWSDEENEQIDAFLERYKAMALSPLRSTRTTWRWQNGGQR